MEQPANWHVMVAISSVDRAMTDEEIRPHRRDRLQAAPIVTTMGSQDHRSLRRDPSADGGLQQVLQLVGEALPEKLRETAFWVALEVAAADRLKRHEETHFLEMLGDALELDRSTTAALERGIHARNMRLQSPV
jgi:hypothetical protein